MNAPVNREHFLPANATPFEQALSETTGRVSFVPIDIDKLWNPSLCPERFLPWLAWALSVDFWNDGWPVERKRQVCREAFEVHRLKGTLAGVRRYIDYADGELISAITPPQEAYLGEVDEDLVDLWRESLPQIHIKPYVNRGIDNGFHLDADFLDDGYLDEFDLGAYVGRRAYYVHEGIETEIEWLEGAGPFAPDGIERLSLKTISPWGTAFCDDAFCDDDDYLGGEAGEYADLIGIERAGLSNVLIAGYEATTAHPKIVPIIYEAGALELFVDDGFLDDGHVFGEEIQPAFYEKYYLYIEGKFPKAPPDSLAYLDVSRLGMPAFTAELKTKIPDSDESKNAIFLDDGFVCLDYVTDNDLSDLWRVCDAVNSSKSLRDKALIDTNVSQIVTFGDGVVFDDFVIGGFI